MSLMDGLLLDNLLQNVMLQEVWLANRTDFLSTGGQGIELDPYEAKGSAADADPPFDKIMRALKAKYDVTQEPITVRLLPGEYYTRGSNSSYNISTTGWQPFSGLRIVGTSMKSTVLKLCNSLPTGSTVAIGSESGAPFLDNFEVNDLTVDAASTSPPSDSCQNGIGVRGKNIYIARVRVTNFGSTGTNAALKYAISAGRTTGVNVPENCVVELCVVDTPKGAGGGKVFGLHLERDTGNEHLFCTLRHNYVDMGQTSGFSADYVGVGVSGGVGTIIEHNRVLNCKTGAELPNLSATTDLIYRHNYFRNVANGSYFDLAGGNQHLGRLIYLNNLIEWGSATTIGAPYGLHLVQGVNGTGKFSNLIISDNVMRRMGGEAANGNEQGVYLSMYAKWDHLVVENNLIELGSSTEKGVSHPALPSGATIKPFNNREMNGTFLAARNRGNSTQDQELTTDVEATIIGL